VVLTAEEGEDGLSGGCRERERKREGLEIKVLNGVSNSDRGVLSRLAAHCVIRLAAD
jgi:hypothetical protein